MNKNGQEFDEEGDEQKECADVPGDQNVQLPQDALIPSDDNEKLLNMFRELIRNRVKEVVRKKAGGGGYTLYSPNKGKKGQSKSVGTFPTKLGAKKAELSRFPPRDPGKLKRLRKQIDKMLKDPKKAAEREKKAAAVKTVAKAKKESVIKEMGFDQVDPHATDADGPLNPKVAVTKLRSATDSNVSDFMSSFGTAAKNDPRAKPAAIAISKELTMNPSIAGKVGKAASKQGKTVFDAMSSISKSAAGIRSSYERKGAVLESADRRKDFLERGIISSIIKKSINESLFKEEERKESDWDQYIDKLSKNALAGDDKFRRLQKNITAKTEGILNDAFNMIKKAVGKTVKMKNFGVKQDSQTGKNYLAFGASFEDTTAEPIYLHIENGVPKIELSGNAKIALTKTDPNAAKLFRAELVTVQERVLDNMDDIAKAIDTRDKYLSKLENNVDVYVAGLSPLEVSLLKQLLVKKYRKIS